MPVVELLSPLCPARTRLTASPSAGAIHGFAVGHDARPLNQGNKNRTHILSCMQVEATVSGVVLCALLSFICCCLRCAGTEPLRLTSSPAVMRAASARCGLAVASSALNSKSLDEPSASVHSRTGASLLLTPHTLHPRNGRLASQPLHNWMLRQCSCAAQCQLFTFQSHAVFSPANLATCHSAVL